MLIMYSLSANPALDPPPQLGLRPSFSLHYILKPRPLPHTLASKTLTNSLLKTKLNLPKYNCEIYKQCNETIFLKYFIPHKQEGNTYTFIILKT